MLPGQWRRLASSYGLAAAVWLLFLLLVFWRLWTPIAGARRSFGWDAQHEYWGDLQFQYDSYAGGELPLWNPHDRTGYPFHADPQAGILYPATWLLLGGAAALGRVPYWLIAIKIVFHFWLAGFGVWVYLRRRGVCPAACHAGGAVLVLSYIFFLNSFSALNWGVAWAPWGLAALDAWARDPTRRRSAAVAFALGMSFLAGAPAGFWYSLLVIVPYGAWATMNGARCAPDRRAYLRAASVSAATAAGLFLAITAAQLRSTAGLLDHTVRHARDLDFIRFSTFGVDDLPGLLMPRMLGSNTYLGAAAVMWAAVALSAFCTTRRLVLAGIAALGFALAMGQNADFLATAASVLEPFGYFRRAHRYLYVAQLPIAILAAEGLDAMVRLEADELGRKIVRGVLICGAIATSAFGVGFALVQKPTAQAQPLRDAFVLACLSIALATWVTAMVLTRRGRRRGAFAWIGAALLAGDLWFARSPDLDKHMFAVPAPRHDAEVGRLDGVPLAARVYDRDYLGFRPGIRLGIRDLGGYEGDPLALARFAVLLEMVKAAPRHLGHLNVGWLLEDERHALKKSAADLAALPALRTGVRRVAQVAPAVMWTAAVELVAGGPKGAAAALFRNMPGQSAVLERESLAGEEAAAAARMAASSAAGHAPPATAGRLVALERNRLVAEVVAPENGVAVIHEAYFPGWRAWIDGVETRVFPANAGFRGLLVGPGAHRIEMEYEAPGTVLFALVSMLGTLGALGWALVGFRRQVDLALDSHGSVRSDDRGDRA